MLMYSLPLAIQQSTIMQKCRNPPSNLIQARIPVKFDSCNDRGRTE